MPVEVLMHNLLSNWLDQKAMREITGMLRRIPSLFLPSLPTAASLHLFFKTKRTRTWVYFLCVTQIFIACLHPLWHNPSPLPPALSQTILESSGMIGAYLALPLTISYFDCKQFSHNDVSLASGRGLFARETRNRVCSPGQHSTA